MEDTNHNDGELQTAANAFNNAHALYMEKRYSEAEKQAVLAATTYEHIANRTHTHVTELGLSWRLIGEIALTLKMYDEASTAFTWALELFEKHNDLVNVMMEQSNLNRVERSKIVDATQKAVGNL